MLYSRHWGLNRHPGFMFMTNLVNRTFSPFQESDESESDYKYSFGFFSVGRKGLPWSDLLKKRLVIILGEAGIGKTFEFENEARTLAVENQAAFFLPRTCLIRWSKLDAGLHFPHYASKVLQ